MTDYVEYYQDQQNCIDDLAVLRKAWGSKSTTPEQWQQLLKTTGLMLLYCPEDMMLTVQSHFDQLVRRMDMLGIERHLEVHAP